MLKIWKDSIKRFWKNILISMTVVVIIVLQNLLFNAEISINGDEYIYPIYLFFFCFIFTITDTIIFYLKNKPGKLDIKYFREHPKNYSPSIMSILMDLKLDCKKDAMADLLYLESLKIVEIDYSKNKIKTIQDYSNLKPHLQVLCNYIEQNKKLKIDKSLEIFKNHQDRFEYEKYCYQESLNLGFIKKENKIFSPFKYYKYLFLGFSSILIYSAILNNESIFAYLFIGAIISFAFFLVLLPTLFVLTFFQRLLLKNRGYRRTELGKEETEKWLV